MKTEFLLVGQGLCGTWLSYFLEQEKREFLVLDPGNLPNASKQAGGLINPVTGRRLVKTWLIDELLPFVRTQYSLVEKLVFSEENDHKNNLIEERTILQFFSNPDTRSVFEKRATEKNDYLQLPEQDLIDPSILDPLLGYGLIQKSCQVQPDLLLSAYKKKLLHQNRLREQKFEWEQLEKSGTEFRYEDVTSDHVIFCDGVGAHQHPLFSHLPFAPVKGEALIVEAPGLSASYIFKGPLTMIPLGQAGHWWVGSSYEWEFADASPSEQFRDHTERTLKQWLKIPFAIVDHWAAIRPGSKERRPFVGMHPQESKIGLLGGMGTKGCSLAPYFAQQLVRHLLYAEPLHPEVDLGRFSRN